MHTLSKEQQSYVKSMDRSSKHLLTLLNSCLDFSKLEQGKLALVSQPFWLRN
jgi:CheY-like chemotaxis protein